MLKYRGPDRSLLRQLQRYAVNVYIEQFYMLLGRGSIDEVQPGIYAMTSEIEYDRQLGLMVDDIQFDAKDLII